MNQPFDADEEVFEEKVDLTPLIDTIFLLLIFFVLTATFLQPVLDISLASAESASIPDERQWTVIAIDREGKVAWEGERVSREQLKERLAKEADKPINFHVDKKTPFEAFTFVVDQAQLQGRHEFVITTLPGPGDNPL